ncbi:MAG: hypothetical protein IK099_08765 [Clostridia bacterium]|nr:hypothetical protein [Clostridia bacterium]
MKKLLALLVALVMALGCAMASAETVYTKIAVNHETANGLIASFGMPEEQMGMVEPLLSLVDALGLKVIAVEDGAEITLDFNGKEALTLGCLMDEKSITAVSTLFPNYAVTMQLDTLTQMMGSMMPGAGEGGEGGMDITAMIEPLMGYFTRFAEACANAAVPGEPVPGAYEFEGCKFDTLVPITVDIQAIAESFKTLMDEMMNDPAAFGAIQGMMQGTGASLDADEMKKGLDEFIAHFPDTVTAEYYTNSDGSPAFYMQGESAYEGKEGASFGYTMLFLDEQNMKMTYWDNENAMSGSIVITANSFRMDFDMAGMTFALDLTFEMGESSVFVCKLYFMDPENPLVTVNVTVSPDSARTLAVDTGDKTVLALETLMNGEGDASGLLGDIMVNGLGGLMTSLTEAVPEMGGMLSMFMGGTGAMAGGDTLRAGKKLLRLGTSGYVIAVDESFEEGELTAEDIANDMVAYMLSPNTLLDFDIYQFSKEGYPEVLADFVKQEAEEYDAFIIAPALDINGIPAGMYRATETYEGKEYTTATYVLEDGDQYVEIAFWLDGEEAIIEAMEIIDTLTYSPAAEGLNAISGDWAVNYFGIPMYFYFDEDGTYLGLIADDSVPLAEDGSNSVTGFWTFDGEKMFMYGEEGEAGDVLEFVVDGLTMTGMIEGMPVVFTRAIEPEQNN